MLRHSIFAATVLLVGCPSKQPTAPRTGVVDDSAVRIRIARAEARHDIAELKQLANNPVALRGLGRLGETTTLYAALSDLDPAIVNAAATALGVAAALDDTLVLDGSKLVPLLARDATRDAAAEALGRGGAPSEQAALRACLPHPSCALALGRFGRRKIALDAETRAALGRMSSYEATYALAREYEPKDVPPALITALASPDAETRAQAIVGITKHKGSAVEQLTAALRDPDGRVVVEAARALAADGRIPLAGLPPHALHEALRALIGKSVDVTAFVKEPGWTGCLAARVAGGPNVVEAVRNCSLPDHLKLPLLADVTDPAARRAALRILLAHEDPRVASAGLGLLATTWADADARTRQTIVTTLTSAVMHRDPILASSAADAISTILDAGSDEALESAIVGRASKESDPDVSASLFGVIEKHKLGAGLDACRNGLAGSAAKAAAACVTALGEAPTVQSGAPKLPPVDVATVIGHRVTWHLTTTKGSIDIELRPDVAPWAVASIAALTQKHFYDNLEFHRVVPDFVVQGGDPTESGMGGPGYALPAEPSGALDGPGFVTGGVGMADSGPGTAGSQWFIMHSRAAHLDGRYTWVGRVTNGQGVADSLVIGDKVINATVEIR